jgi:hypothetical protein
MWATTDGRLPTNVTPGGVSSDASVTSTPSRPRPVQTTVDGAAPARIDSGRAPSSAAPVEDAGATGGIVVRSGGSTHAPSTAAAMAATATAAVVVDTAGGFPVCGPPKRRTAPSRRTVDVSAGSWRGTCVR